MSFAGNVFRGVRSRERYLFKRDDSRRSVSVCMAYPDLYRAGMSSLGYQHIYYLFNRHPMIACDRMFLPPLSLQNQLRRRGGKNLSIEKERELASYDMVAFSLSFENGYVDAARMLHESGISPSRSKRGEKAPVVLAGGAAVSSNPLPFSAIADALFIGEADGAVDKIARLLAEKKREGLSKQEMLSALSGIDGIYVPEKGGPVSRVSALSFEALDVHSCIMTRDSEFSDTFLLEVSRGCRYSCSFCLTGCFGGAYREHPPEKLIEIIKRHSADIKKAGLIGSTLADYSGIEALCSYLLDNSIKYSFSSVRFAGQNAGLLELIKKGGAKTITIAPEAGTETLRKRIGKNLSDAEIMKLAGDIGRSGIQNIRLYFIAGFEFESAADIDAIAQLTAEIAGASGIKSVQVSVNPFIPKPHTVFQELRMAPEEYLAAAGDRIKAGLKRHKNITVKMESLRLSRLQWKLSIGGAEAGEKIIDCLLRGTPVSSEFDKYDPHENIKNGDAPWNIVKQR